VLQSGNVPDSLGVDKAEKKLQENEDLMKRLTGMWEEKWSKTQKLIEVKGPALYLQVLSCHLFVAAMLCYTLSIRKLSILRLMWSFKST